MNLRNEVSRWDGKRTSYIEAVYLQHESDPLLGRELGFMLVEDEVQLGASWLLKRYLESGQKLGPDETFSVLTSANGLKHWGSRLHFLQCLPYLRILNSEKDALAAFIRACVADSNKFVRAWAYNGFFELSEQYPEFNAEVEHYLEMGQSEAAASVRARIRNIKKRLR
jgi:hypothetical protein